MPNTHEFESHFATDVTSNSRPGSIPLKSKLVAMFRGRSRRKSMQPGRSTPTAAAVELLETRQLLSAISVSALDDGLGHSRDVCSCHNTSDGGLGSNPAQFSNPIFSVPESTNFDGQFVTDVQQQPAAAGTVTLEFRTDATQRYGMLIGHFNPVDSRHRIYLSVQGDDLYARLGSGRDQRIAQNITDGEWHKLAFVYGGRPDLGDTPPSVYLDGNLAGTVTAPGHRLVTTSELKIGGVTDARGGSQLRFQGEIRNVNFYDTLLSAEQIVAVFENDTRTTKSNNEPESRRRRSDDAATNKADVAFDGVFGENVDGVFRRNSLYSVAGGGNLLPGQAYTHEVSKQPYLQHRLDDVLTLLDDWNGVLERDLIRLRVKEKSVVTVTVEKIDNVTTTSTNPSDSRLDANEVQPGLVVRAFKSALTGTSDSLQGTSPFSTHKNSAIEIGYRRGPKVEGAPKKGRKIINDVVASFVLNGSATLVVEKIGLYFKGYRLNIKSEPISSTQGTSKIELQKFDVNHLGKGRATFAKTQPVNVELRRPFDDSATNTDTAQVWVVVHGRSQSATEGKSNSQDIENLTNAVKSNVGLSTGTQIFSINYNGSKVILSS